MTEPRRRGRPTTNLPKKEFSLAARGTAAHARALKQLAARTAGRSVSTEILLAIEAWLGKHKLWPPPRGG